LRWKNLRKKREKFESEVLRMLVKNYKNYEPSWIPVFLKLILN
jgi:hypothetical protein